MTTDGYNGVMRALAELNEQQGTERYKCPLAAELINQLRAKYEIPVGDDSWFTIADFMFNPQLTINRYTGFWPPIYFIKWFWTRWTTN